ncbi:MAG: Uma2 family endonuclease [Deltaproteobacteria bacterium]|nr:Uma2 family endonuclease [Deltaproteobacteria bacterium]
MKVTLQLPRRASYADYLAVEDLSAHRHELIEGVIVAMAGGSDEHNAIAGKIAMLFGMRTSGACRYYTPDQRFWIASSFRGRYSDGSIICGKPEHPPHDPQATTNPAVVVEVLSPSSEGDDDGDKRRDFQACPSLQAYVLTCQDERRVMVYRRSETGDWLAEADIYRDDDSFRLPMLDADIAVAAIYDGILDAHGASLLR